MSAFPGFPHPGFPEGWFCVGWSDDFPAGEVRSLRYFGEDLIAFRTAEGKLAVMDAYCPHMGAHLAVGGRVEGDCIVCPFHGWRWNTEGRNAAIPDMERVLSNARIRSYTVAEMQPFVMVWYSWRSEQPTWEAPRLTGTLDSSMFWDPVASRRLWSKLRLVPQMVQENIVDCSHIKYVHLAQEGGRIAKLEEQGKTFYVELDQTFMTRGGPVLGKDYIYALGIGASIATMEFKGYRIVNVLLTTPVEMDRSDMRASVFVQLPSGEPHPASASALPERLQRAIRAHLDSQEQDIPLWQAMRYQANPLLTGQEVQGHVRFRKWANQFYQS